MRLWPWISESGLDCLTCAIFGGHRAARWCPPSAAGASSRSLPHRASLRYATVERKGNNFQDFEDFFLNSKLALTVFHVPYSSKSSKYGTCKTVQDCLMVSSFRGGRVVQESAANRIAQVRQIPGEKATPSKVYLKSKAKM